MMHPADQISTETQSSLFLFWSFQVVKLLLVLYSGPQRGTSTGLRVVHPVEDDLGRSVPARHHVARHLSVGLPGQAEIQNLKPKAGI